MKSRKKRKGRKDCWRGKCLALVPLTSPRVIAAAARPTEAFLAVHQITCAAQAAGWPGREGFAAAMYLHLHGTTVSEAKAAFADCERFIQ